MQQGNGLLSLGSAQYKHTENTAHVNLQVHKDTYWHALRFVYKRSSILGKVHFKGWGKVDGV